jgi:DNA-binding beta-propeller fold protein YncE
MNLCPKTPMRLIYAGLLAFLGCTASSAQVAPPEFDPYYPTGLVMSPDEKYLFVISANSDLRYDSGTVQVYDVEEVARIATAWKTGQPGTCAFEPSRPTVLRCLSSTAGAAAEYVVGSSVKIGNFAVGGGVQELANGSLRLFVTVRGDPSITWVDFDPTSGDLSCGGEGSFQRCDEAHRLDQVRNDETLTTLPSEPFGIYVDGAAGHVFTTHLSTGQVTFASAPPDGEPMIEDIISDLWERSVATNALGAVGIARRIPGDPDSLVYVTSRQEARVATLFISQGTDRDVIGRGNSFFLPGLVTGLSADMRDVKFSADGNRMYLVSRTPPSLIAYDTSLDEQGQPANRMLSQVEVCGQPSSLAIADLGEGGRAYVPCFANGQTWVFDLDRLELIATTDVGRGPNAVAVSPTHRLVFVANYADDTVGVMDITPGDATENTTILRLGHQRDAENLQ